MCKCTGQGQNVECVATLSSSSATTTFRNYKVRSSCSSPILLKNPLQTVRGSVASDSHCSIDLILIILLYMIILRYRAGRGLCGRFL